MIYKSKWTRFIKLAINLIEVMNLEVSMLKIRKDQIKLVKSNIAV